MCIVKQLNNKAMPYITKEQVKEKRQAIKKAFPEFKFSITLDNYSGIRIAVMEGPEWFAKDGFHKTMNGWSKVMGSPEADAVIAKISDIANEGNGTEVEDGDYGRVPNFYVWLSVGKWDKGYKVSSKEKIQEKKVQEEKPEEEIETIKFETGKSYTYGYIGDSSIKVRINIVRRTEKTVWFTVRNEQEVKKARIKVYDNEESFAPDGTGYSMHPICCASKLVKEDAEKVELNETNCKNMTSEPFEEKATELMTEETQEEEAAPELSFASVFGGMGERKPIETEGMLLHKYLDIAIRAHNGTSFSPERRGKQYIRDYSNELAEDLETVEKYGGDVARYREKYERLFVDWMHSKGNCISSMITGSSRFPARYAEKRNNWERNKANALEDWRQRALNAIKRDFRKAHAPDPIVAAKRKYEQERDMLERMKAANKIVKSKKMTESEKALALVNAGFSRGTARSILSSDWNNKIGFQSFQLTNCRNRMKAAKARYEELERRANTEAVEEEREDGIRVVQNVEANRLQVFFPGKPEYEMRKQLKSNGFRWAPSHGCWQAYLNDRSISKIESIL